MRIAYLILAHDDPVHLSRLVRTSSHGEDRCFIHLDAKASADRFASSKIATSEIIAARIPRLSSPASSRMRMGRWSTDWIG
jgi:hypothetical protein